MLGPAEAASPAGQALRADAFARVESLRVADRFPLRLPWAAALVPVGAVTLVLLALFYRPTPGQAQADAQQPLAESPAVRAEIERQMKQLQKKERPKEAQDKGRSPDLERLEAELDKLAQQPRDTREQARDVVKEMTRVEDQVRRREKELAERADALKEQMKQVERLSKKRSKDGPARNLQRALSQGDFNKAQDEMDRLRKKLQEQEEAERLRKKLKEDKGLTEEQRKEIQERLKKLEDEQLSREQKDQLEEQLQDLKDQLERLARQQDEEELLREMERKGEIDKGQLDRELEQLAKNLDKLDPQELEALKEIAAELGQCEKCMKEGKDGEAAKRLAAAGARLAKLDRAGECRALGRKLQQLQAARRAVCRALGGNQPNPASGARPEAKEGETGSKEERARSELDKGELQVVDQVPGEGFKGPRKPAEMTEEIRRAAQEAPEAIDRQRLPRSASDMARGYFERLRGPDKKK
jgi:DNA repair exonuclease SbcCD ATPase subunit